MQTYRKPEGRAGSLDQTTKMIRQNDKEHTDKIYTQERWLTSHKWSKQSNKRDNKKSKKWTELKRETEQMNERQLNLQFK